MSPNTTKPHVVLLSLEHETFHDSALAPVIAAIETKAHIVHAKNHLSALEAIARNPKAVLVTDAGIERAEAARVLAALVQYTKNGGTVVFAGQFSSNISSVELDTFFRPWGLNWSCGSYHRSTHHLSPRRAERLHGNDKLAYEYTMKAVNLKVPYDHHVFYGLKDEWEEAPAVYARVEEGWVGYLGDVNSEEASIQVILSMLNLVHEHIHHKHTVVILSLEHEDFHDAVMANLRAALERHSHVSHIKHHSAAIDAISRNPKAVLVTDAGIKRREHSHVRAKLVEYTKWGGIVVFGGQFSSNISPVELDKFFVPWGLEWSCGSYRRLIYSLNPTRAEKLKGNDRLTFEYNMKALNVKVEDTRHMFYGPSADSGSVTPSTASDCTRRSAIAEDEAPAAYAQVGDGWVGYLGDVNSEDVSIEVALAMLGLPEVYHKPPVLVISLEWSPEHSSSMSHLFANLEKKAIVTHVKDKASALSAIETTKPDAIFVTDAGIERIEAVKVLASLVEYALQGGLVVFGGQFSSQVSAVELDTFFRRPWGLSWTCGSYSRIVGALNAHRADILKSGDNEKLPLSYGMKALQIRVPSSEDVFYGVADTKAPAKPFTAPPILDFEEAPVVFSRIGKGGVGYVGDVNCEDKSTEVVLKLLGLDRCVF